MSFFRRLFQRSDSVERPSPIELEVEVPGSVSGIRTEIVNPTSHTTRDSVADVQSCRRGGIATMRGGEAVDACGTLTARRSEGLTRHCPNALTIVAVRRLRRATVPRTVRPSSVSNSTAIPTENLASWVRFLAERRSCKRSTTRRFRSINSSSDSFVRSTSMQLGQYKVTDRSLQSRNA